ncbi:Uncharacterised protein [Bordetella pertussis]|nr:Uncharacterised protein [Bordetella pertussis]
MMASGGAPTEVMVPMTPEARPAPDIWAGEALIRTPATLMPTAARMDTANSTDSSCGAKRVRA